MALLVPEPAPARRLRDAFSNAGYCESAIPDLLGQAFPLRLTEPEKQRHAESLTNQGVLGVLLQLFFLEQEITLERYRSILPRQLRQDLEDTGLVSTTASCANAAVLLVPVENKLVAGDRYQKLPEDSGAEHVLSVNAPARLLARLAIPRATDHLLDLCTGNGIFAVMLAGQARQVIATDINPRALELTRFNAAINQVGNIECRLGDGYAPVSGEQFDHIICNPPYIITPNQGLVATDTRESLDDFCKNLVRAAPAHLREGGIMQMICEWAQVAGEDWRERVTGWFEGSGCDAWVIASGYSPIAEYATRRRAQALAACEPGSVGSLDHWLEYFRRKSVAGVRSGFVQLRKRGGQTWTSFTSLGGRIKQQVGMEIEAGFAARDRYLGASNQEILAMRLCSNRDLEITDGQNPRVQKRSGLPVSFAASPAVIELLSGLREPRRLRDVSDALATAAGVPIGSARQQCCAIARELLVHGFLEAAADKK